jgi:hypothetical protein
MAKKKIAEENRIVDEMLEMAQALQGHALISKQDMAKMKLICQSPPEYTKRDVYPREKGEGESICFCIDIERECFCSTKMGITQLW